MLPVLLRSAVWITPPVPRFKMPEDPAMVYCCPVPGAADKPMKLIPAAFTVPLVSALGLTKVEPVAPIWAIALPLLFHPVLLLPSHHWFVPSHWPEPLGWPAVPALAPQIEV